MSKEYWLGQAAMRHIPTFIQRGGASYSTVYYNGDFSIGRYD